MESRGGWVGCPGPPHSCTVGPVFGGSWVATTGGPTRVPPRSDLASTGTGVVRPSPTTGRQGVHLRFHPETTGITVDLGRRLHSSLCLSLSLSFSISNSVVLGLGPVSCRIFTPPRLRLRLRPVENPSVSSRPVSVATGVVQPDQSPSLRTHRSSSYVPERDSRAPRGSKLESVRRSRVSMVLVSFTS